MNRAIRRVGIAVSVLILVLVAQLTYLQVVDAENLANDPPQRPHARSRDFNRPRGKIITADGEIVARSIPTSDGEFKYQRAYPLGELFARSSATSRSSVGNTGVETSYNDVLTGRDAGLRFSNLATLHRQGTTPATSCSRSRRRRSRRPPTRSAARRGIGRRARTRRPARSSRCTRTRRFDPKPLAGHDPAVVQATFDALIDDPATTRRCHARTARSTRRARRSRS